MTSAVWNLTKIEKDGDASTTKMDNENLWWAGMSGSEDGEGGTNALIVLSLW